MPIVGLSDRPLAFPEIGQIRKGGKKVKDEKTGIERVGPDLKYFRVEFDERDVETEKKFREIYGDKPDTLNIVLAFKTVEQVWDAWLEAYTAGRMVARSDGERFVYKVNTKSGEVETANGEYIKYDPKTPVGTYGKDNKPIFCKPVGRLRVVIPELKRLAFLTVLTTSLHDIINISSELNGIYQMTNGNIAGIPLVLRRTPKMISTPSADGQRARREKWLLSIEADPTWVEKKLDSMRMLSFPQSDVIDVPAIGPGISSSFASLPDGDDDEAEDEIPGINEQEKIIDAKIEPNNINSKMYWDLVAELGITPVQGQAVLTERGGDYSDAYYKLKKG